MMSEQHPGLVDVATGSAGRSANPWFRMYAEFAHDPKVQSMSEAMQRRLMMLLCLRCSNTLVTLHDDELAFALRVSDEDLAQTKALFLRKNFIDEGWNILNWDKRQFTSDSSAARVKRHRDRKKAAEEGAKNKVVTLQKRETNALDTDTDTDTEELQLPLSADADDVRLCPVGQLLNLYHELMPLNPRVKVASDSRKAAIRARWKQAAALDCEPFGYTARSAGLAAWRAFFQVCAESKFLTGQAPPSVPGKPAFIADIDFIFSPSGFAKILENKYHRDAA
ncbi:hypothetical protein GJ698_15015 [Pseudoduganella sp. FT26W]|uniref:DUF1376 domain-containing protein n=1 Tax=Duganella aquatilis TaxID=2666082 RepID=A0A844D6B8_9BURK|nr:hypothetical protein [Duganella aquatilis]MRW85395.1 hypothetical protein [Duganella aquatilis]